MCRRAGFRQIVLRGDTAFSQSERLDGWDGDGVTLLLRLQGDAEPGGRLPTNSAENGVEEAGPAAAVRGADRSRGSGPRTSSSGSCGSGSSRSCGCRAKRYAEFEYQPGECKQTLSHDRGPQEHLAREGRDSGCSTRSATSSTSPTTGQATPEEVVFEANDRCDQENLIAQLAGGVRALSAPVDNLDSNWAYMVMTALGLEPQGVVGVVAARRRPLAGEAPGGETATCCGWSSRRS